jgi:hypothetical protein
MNKPETNKSIDELLTIAKEVMSIYEKYNLTKEEARIIGHMIWEYIIPLSNLEGEI